MLEKFIGKGNVGSFLDQVNVLFNRLNDAIFVLNQRGEIITLNHSACRLTGYQEDEVVGKPISDFVQDHPPAAKEDLDTHPSNLHPPAPSNENLPPPMRSEFLLRNGQKLPVEVTHLHIKEIKEDLSMVIVRNISEQKIAEILRESSITLFSTLNPVDVFDHLLVEVRKLIPFDGGNIMVVADKSVHITRTLGYDAFGTHLSDLVNSLCFDLDKTENLRRIVNEFQTVIIPDTHHATDWYFNDAAALFRSWIGVPIIIDGKVDAIISLDKIEPDFFNEDHASVLSIFSNQAASAIKNARLYEAEARRIQQLDGLQSTLIAINSQPDLTSLLKEIVIKAIQLLNTSIGELALHNPESGQLEIIVSYHAKKDFTGQPLKIGSGLMGRVAATKKPIKADRLANDPEVLAELKLIGSNSGMAVPLIAGEEFLGVLGIADLKPNRIFDNADVGLLNSFAQQATIAIQNSRLFEDAKHRAEEAEILRQVGAVVTSSLNQNQTITLILEQLEQVIPSDNAIVLLKQKDALQIVGIHGKSGTDNVIGTKVLLTEKIPPVEVFLQKKPILIRNSSEIYSSYKDNQNKAMKINSWLGAPLIIQDRSIGVISLGSQTVDHFSREHLHLVTTFADQVAIALENARLYTDTARQAERFRTLYHLSQIISTNLRSEDIYPAIHQAVTELMITDFFCISLFDTKTQVIQDVYKVDRGKHIPVSSRPMDKGLTSTVMQKRKSMLFHTFDAATAKEVGSVMLANLGAEEMPQSILIVPLNIGATCIGVLSAQSYLPNMYSSSDQEMLELLSANVAIAIENARLFDEVQQFAITDPLTKLFNRRKFEELSLTEFERSKRYLRPLCIIMIDLDEFKQVNDTHGHMAGDQVLIGMASLCKKSLRSIDILARVGGEEFMILLPETDSVEALVIAERLRQDVQNTSFDTHQGSISLTISLGIADLDDSCKSLEELADRADCALYASKYGGRNRSSLWTPELDRNTPSDGPAPLIT